MSERKISYENYVRQELQKKAFEDRDMIWKMRENNKIWQEMQEKKNCKCKKRYSNYE